MPNSQARAQTSSTEKRERGRRCASTGRSHARALTTTWSSGGKRPRPAGPGRVREAPTRCVPAAAPLLDGLAGEPAAVRHLRVGELRMLVQHEGKARAHDLAVGCGMLGGDAASEFQLLGRELGSMGGLG